METCGVSSRSPLMSLFIFHDAKISDVYNASARGVTDTSGKAVGDCGIIIDGLKWCVCVCSVFVMCVYKKYGGVVVVVVIVTRKCKLLDFRFQILEIPPFDLSLINKQHY